MRRWRAYSSPEDLEYFDCQQELQTELYKAYMNPERVIGTRQWLT